MLSIDKCYPFHISFNKNFASLLTAANAPSFKKEKKLNQRFSCLFHSHEMRLLAHSGPFTDFAVLSYTSTVKSLPFHIPEAWKTEFQFRGSVFFFFFLFLFFKRMRQSLVLVETTKVFHSKPVYILCLISWLMGALWATGLDVFTCLIEQRTVTTYRIETSAGSRPWDKERGAGLQKKLFRPLGPQFGLKIRGGPGPPGPSPGSATGN